MATNPMDLFEEIRDRAIEMAKLAFMQSEKPWPADDDPVLEGLILPLLGIGVAAASEYFAQHPEAVALAGQPICTECRAPVETLHVGPAEGSEMPVKVAWPCGHLQVIA